MSIDIDAARTIAKRLHFQARACADLGSPLYADLLEGAVEDALRGGAVWEVLRDHRDDPGPSALALRFMGSVHRLTLDGSAPELAGIYTDSSRDSERARAAFLGTVEANRERLKELVELPVQTNEVGRCAALLPGFLAVAKQTGLPLRLLEAGSSAGLNLRFDRYRYEMGDFAWGPDDSSVRLTPRLTGLAPDPAPIEIAERAGCDAAPVDPATPEGRLTLLSYLWPDQPHRIERLSAALSTAAEVAAIVERRGAAEWIADQLAGASPDVATVVFHSIFIQYPSEEERRAFIAEVEAAGRRATAPAPMAWLRMEPGSEMTDVKLTIWPGGEERLLARAGYHGDPVELV